MEPSSSPRPRRTFSNTRDDRRVRTEGYTPRAPRTPRTEYTPRSRTEHTPRRPYPHNTSGTTSAAGGAAGGTGRNIRFVQNTEPRKRVRAQARQRRSTTSPALVQRMPTDVRPMNVQPVTDPDIVRIGVVSGVEGVGRNMSFYEDKENIIIFDCGLQFVSPLSKAPGVNFILPNTQYLEAHKHKIRAMFVSHGHLDHTGGISFLIGRLGNPPIYTQYLTSLLILKRHEEYPSLDALNLQIIKEGESVTFGTGLKVKTFPVTHSIPDAMGVMVHTPWGNVIYGGDSRLDHKDGEVVGEEKKYWESVGSQKNLIFIGDSTNCDRPGFSRPESVVFESIRRYIRDTKGRLVIGTFASQFDRLTSIVEACHEFGRVIVPEGRSIKTNLEIGIKAGLIKVPAGTIVSAPEAEKYPRDKVVILATGAQGEEFAALPRMASGEHKFIKLDQYDTVLLSSSVIPGNELSVQSLKDKIYRNNCRVVTYQGDDIHSSGHGYAGEMNWIRRTVNPKFLMPVHGNHFHLKSHMYAAVEDGFPRENVIVPDNGSIVEIYKGEMLRILPEKMPNEDITVDGVSVGLRQEVVLRDRIALSNDGMFVVVASLDTRTGKLRKSPDIISRGFIYLRENQQLLSDARTMVRDQIERSTAQSRHIDLDVLRDEVTESLTKFLLTQTNKTPIVIPVIIGF